jgi:hypothetical protein
MKQTIKQPHDTIKKTDTLSLRAQCLSGRNADVVGASSGIIRTPRGERWYTTSVKNALARA